MKRGRKRTVLLVVAVILAGGAGFAVYQWSRVRQVAFVTGAVLRNEADPNKQRPVANAVVSVVSGQVTGQTRTDALGYFRVPLRPGVDPGQPILLTFRHPDYFPLELKQIAEPEIYVVRLSPKVPDPRVPSGEPQLTIANIRLRYAVKSTTAADIGSIVRTFEVVNTGNIPCNEQPPCSPDGRWKATVLPFSLDAGAGNEFRDVRVSCVAGPCPFTRVESDQYSRGGRVIGLTVRNWSDRVTYLVEAEVVQTAANDVIRRSYPAIFGRTMDFTLPPTAEGPSIEAEVDGTEIVFPLGPNLNLSWATCKLEVGGDRSRLYRCELKPRYRFK